MYFYLFNLFSLAYFVACFPGLPWDFLQLIFIILMLLKHASAVVFLTPTHTETTKGIIFIHFGIQSDINDEKEVELCFESDNLVFDNDVCEL